VQRDPSRRFRVQDVQSVDEIVEPLLGRGDGPRPAIGGRHDRLADRSGDHLPRLFERFYRVDSTHAARSLGLGLYITQGIVVSHGGRIWAESDGEGRSSRFIFTLPYAGSARNRAAAGEHTSGLPSFGHPAADIQQTGATA
jgi:hypothetical protein